MRQRPKSRERLAEEYGGRRTDTRRPSSKGVSAAGQRLANPHFAAGTELNLSSMSEAAWITAAAADPAQIVPAQAGAATKARLVGCNATVPPAITTPHYNNIVFRGGRQGPMDSISGI